MPKIHYCCPRCGGKLDAWSERYECLSCGKTYPIITGIPDFRVYPDPYIGLEADRAKGRYLASKATQLSFTELVAHYYKITPEVTPDQARRFQAHHLAGLMRGRGMLERLQAYRLSASAGLSDHMLDLGCGTGGFLVAAAAEGSQIVGVDIAFRWLVIGRRRLEECGAEDVRLVCACADYLPFPNQCFDLVVAENLLEHTLAPAAVLTEILRVRRFGGALMARVVNRYALAPEPHVGLWGVGFLPRRAMDHYVRWRRGIPYEHITPQSYADLRCMIRASGRTDLRVCRPHLTRADYQHHPPLHRRLFEWYMRLGRWFPLVRPVLTLFGPYLDIVSQPNRSVAQPRTSDLHS